MMQYCCYFKGKPLFPANSSSVRLLSWWYLDIMHARSHPRIIIENLVTNIDNVDEVGEGGIFLIELKIQFSSFGILDDFYFETLIWQQYPKEPHATFV